MKGNLIEQANYILKVTGVSATKGSEFVKTLNLKNEFVHHAEKKKKFMERYLYIFEVELLNNEETRSWT